jgi:hypothetical protein
MPFKWGGVWRLQNLYPINGINGELNDLIPAAITGTSLHRTIKNNAPGFLSYKDEDEFVRKKYKKHLNLWKNNQDY